MNTVFVVVLAVLGALGAVTAVHFTLLTVAALWYREPRSESVPPIRFLILIPAHNEAVVIEETLRAINRERRAGDLVVVVADRCTDDTAAIARRHEATVVERELDEEPGRAAARQAGLEAARELEWDAIVMIDADSIVQSGFFDGCERALATGALALQTRSEAALDSRLVAQATVASFALQGITIPRGRDRLGLSVRLRGTGMVLRREVCERFRFRAPASEDLWYSLDLCLAGVLPRHVESARLRSENVHSWRAASRQKRRYEAGRTSAAVEFVGPLLRRHDRASLEAAWFLLSPPFAIATLLLLVAAVGEWIAGAGVLSVVFFGLTALLAADLVVALVLARVPRRTWYALLIFPWYLVWKAVVQLLAFKSVLRRTEDYGATERVPEQTRSRSVGEP